ncbi:MAG: hypothetical protein WC242_01040 [Candidatus Paceibacterota bacterium]|jgi:hypothetical protein
METINSREIFIQPETLRELEGATELMVQSKIALLAVILDIKPASFIETDLIHPEEVLLAKKHIEELFSRCGLAHKENSVDYQNEPFVSLGYIVARTQEFLEKVQDAQDHQGEMSKYHNAFGKALGIPDSAVDGFVSGKKLSQDEIRDKLTREERAFVFFMPSIEGWESEMGIVRNLAAKVKEISPVLYAQALSQIND